MTDEELKARKTLLRMQAKLLLLEQRVAKLERQAEPVEAE